MSEQSIQPKPTENKSRTERVKRLCFLIWAIIGIILLVIAAGYILGQIKTALAIVGLSAFIVFILRVPVAWLERRGVHRLPGTAIAYLGSFIIIALILLIFIPLIWEQTLGLIQLIPGYVNDATIAFNEFYQEYSYLLEDSNIKQVVAGAASDLSSWAREIVSQSTIGAINLGVNLATALIVFVVSLVASFWVLKDLPRIGRELRIIIGPKREQEVMFIATSVSRAFGGYLRGMTISGASVGIMAGVGYYLLGLPYPAVLGLMIGLLNFIPFIGPWIAGFVVAVIGLFISPLIALISIVITVVAEQITDNLVLPRVMYSVVDMHPAVILVAVVAGGALGGPIGLICAIPLLSAVKAIYVHYFEKRTGRKLGNEKGALFKVHAPSKDGDDAAGAGGDDAADAGGDASQSGEAVSGTGAGAAKEHKIANLVSKIKTATDKRNNREK